MKMGPWVWYREIVTDTFMCYLQHNSKGLNFFNLQIGVSVNYKLRSVRTGFPGKNLISH